jgi:hypothetical protein
VCAAAPAETGASLIVVMIISSLLLVPGRRLRKPEREMSIGEKRKIVGRRDQATAMGLAETVLQDKHPAG